VVISVRSLLGSLYGLLFNNKEKNTECYTHINIYINCLTVCVFFLMIMIMIMKVHQALQQLILLETIKWLSYAWGAPSHNTKVFTKKTYTKIVTKPPIEWPNLLLCAVASKDFVTTFSLACYYYSPPRELKSQTAWRSLDTDLVSLPISFSDPHSLPLSLFHSPVDASFSGNC